MGKWWRKYFRLQNFFLRAHVKLSFRTYHDSHLHLTISFVDDSIGRVSPPIRLIDIHGAEAEDGNHRQMSADVCLPSGFGNPGAVIVKARHQGGSRQFYLETVSVSRLGKSSKVLSASFPCFSWISSDHGYRVFFTNIAAVPKKTPACIEDLRTADLAAQSQADKSMRYKTDRIYDYDVYNDLCNPEETTKRKEWGGARGQPYPRRLRTGLHLVPNRGLIRSYCPPGSERVEPFWVPSDDDFTPEKLHQFAALRTDIFSQVHTVAESHADSSEGFTDLKSIEYLYTSAPQGPGFPVPGVLKGRRDVLRRDAEFGRQRVDGVHPTFIEAIKMLPIGSSITNKTVDPSLLDGQVLENRLKQGRMFLIDYSTILLDFATRIRNQPGPQTRFQYAPRCLMYWNDRGQLLPVAIELLQPPESPSVKEIYTPCDSLTEWSLAKAHFLAADLTIHELYTNFTRSYACVEPYIISARRNLSTAHPVFRLLMPHFQNILRANAVARQSLINEGGLLEAILTPGALIGDIAMGLYAKLWRFKTESLPGDLIKRKMATVSEGANWRAGEVDLVLEDYPYAENGIRMWQALYKWVSSYLSVYYTDPVDVLGDAELQVWWEEIKSKGHPDLVNFGIAEEEDVWPSLSSVDDLAYILVTMIWVVSGHRAAVNLGKYDYIGYMPNMPSLMVGPMPSPGTIQTPPDILNEEKLVGCLAPPIIAAQAMAVARIWTFLGWDDMWLWPQNELCMSNKKLKKAFRKFTCEIRRHLAQLVVRNID